MTRKQNFIEFANGTRLDAEFLIRAAACAVAVDSVEHLQSLVVLLLGVVHKHDPETAASVLAHLRNPQPTEQER